MQEIVVEEAMEGQRLNKLLARYLDAAPQSFIYKMFRKKNIKYNHRKATGNEIVQTGDVVGIYMADDTIKAFRKDGKLPKTRVVCAGTNVGASDRKKEYLPCGADVMTEKKNPLWDVEILFENEDVLILNKPVGMLSQKAKPEDYSLNERIVDYYFERNGEDAFFTPSVCNRLDRNTSGIILAGMSLKGTRELSRMLKERSLDKYYLTIVCGEVEKPADIKGFLAKKKNHNQVVVYRSAEEAGQDGADFSYIETRYEPLATGRFQGMSFSLVRVKLITGKTHQIRAHFDSIGHSIVGDGKYGLKSVNAVMKREFGLKHQLLHACLLDIPVTNCGLEALAGREFRADLPEDFREIGGRLFGNGCMEKLRCSPENTNGSNL